jgi:hypothetical protein
MRTVAVARICLALGACSPALAEWKTQNVTDQMTDRASVVVTLASSTPVAAKLRVSCYPSMVGHPAFLFPEIVFETAVGFGKVSATYRFDNRTVEPRIVPVLDGGRAVSLWPAQPVDAAKEIGKSKRLRVQVFPAAGGEPLFLDFDLTGADKAIAQIRCG